MEANISSIVVLTKAFLFTFYGQVARENLDVFG
jgi:hypothetical protein